jgi:hypothetical protein
MSAKKKQSDISEPTQPERPKRFMRRNSFHTLHCRSGSLKKFENISQELPTPEPTPEIRTRKNPKPRKQTLDVDT